MKSIHLDNLNNRTQQFARNIQLEELLKELSSLLGPVDEQVSAQFERPKWPPLFLVGSPRSGTTFVMQLLNATGQFAVPTNLLSRFYYAPYLGAKIQQLLTDKNFDYNNEMGDFASKGEFHSSLGKTTNALSPSEFTYFWRRFIPNYDPQYLSPLEEEQIDGRGLASGFAAVEAVLQRPLATKAFIIQYNLPKLYELFKNCIFVQVRRNSLYVMQSIYEARKSFYNTLDIWWSVKPKEFPELQHLDVYKQIAGQIFYTERALADGLSQVPEQSRLVVEYEEICENPSDFYRKLKDKYKENDYELPDDVKLPNAFSPSNKIRIPEAEIQKLTVAYESFANAESNIK
jgi:sulfotransferase family protein